MNPKAPNLADKHAYIVPSRDLATFNHFFQKKKLGL